MVLSGLDVDRIHVVVSVHADHRPSGGPVRSGALDVAFGLSPVAVVVAVGRDEVREYAGDERTHIRQTGAHDSDVDLGGRPVCRTHVVV